jgi:hypothetical protein
MKTRKYEIEYNHNATMKISKIVDYLVTKEVLILKIFHSVGILNFKELQLNSIFLLTKLDLEICINVAGISKCKYIAHCQTDNYLTIVLEKRTSKK